MQIIFIASSLKEMLNMNTFVIVSVLALLRVHSATQHFGESMLEDFLFAPDEVHLPPGSLIGGAMVAGDGEPFEIVRPSDGRVLRTERSASADGQSSWQGIPSAPAFGRMRRRNSVPEFFAVGRS
jgi:hypothetical protein